MRVVHKVNKLGKLILLTRPPDLCPDQERIQASALTSPGAWHPCFGCFAKFENMQLSPPGPNMCASAMAVQPDYIDQLCCLCGRIVARAVSVSRCADAVTLPTLRVRAERQADTGADTTAQGPKCSLAER